MKQSIYLDSEPSKVQNPVLILRRNDFHEAAWYGQEKVVLKLLERGANIDETNGAGETALHQAARNKCTAMVQLLLDKGAEIDATDYDGDTALHSAAWYGCEEVVELLVERGAKIDAKNKSGETAQDRAARKGHQAIVQLLGNRAKGNNKEMEEQHFTPGQNPEDILAKEKRENPTQYLIDIREALTKAMKRSLQNKNPSTKKRQKFGGTKDIEHPPCSMKELVSLSLSQTTV
jgi:ankyrin repeat protein